MSNRIIPYTLKQGDILRILYNRKNKRDWNKRLVIPQDYFTAIHCAYQHCNEILKEGDEIVGKWGNRHGHSKHYHAKCAKVLHIT